MGYEQDLAAAAKAKTGHVLVRTEDERRVLTKTRQVARSFRGGNVWIWTCTDGFRRDGGTGDGNTDPGAFFPTLAGWRQGPTFLLAPRFCSVAAKMPTLDVIIQQSVDLTEGNGAIRGMKEKDAENFVQIIFIDDANPPKGMSVTEIAFPVPDRKEMGALLDAIAEAADAPDFDREIALNGLMGLPAFQAENALSMSIVKTGKIDPTSLKDYKRNMVKAAGLEWIDPDPKGLRGMAGVGGLENLKAWLQAIKTGFDPIRAAEFDLAPPSGIMLAGVPGTGKSFVSEKLAEDLGVVLLRLNLGALMDKYLGGSEGNFRAMLDTVERVAPAVLVVDEAEKAFATGSAETEGSTSERIMGTFLTWLQEKRSPVFVVMTANDVSKLRPELLREGRLDAKFWLDVPNYSERLAIVRVFQKKYRKITEIDAVAVAKMSEGWTGAEIEAAIKATLRFAMQTGAEITTEAVIARIRTTSKVGDSPKVKAAREATKADYQPASIPDSEGPADPGTGFRKLGL